MVAVAPTLEPPGSQLPPSYLVKVTFWVPLSSAGKTVTGQRGPPTNLRAMTDRLPRRPRSDARHTRYRILDAALTAFVTDGLDVPIRVIARRAEVGPATAYRHFPTKETLLTEVFTVQTLAWRSVLNEGLADPDPWHGFCRTIEKLCELQARDHGFTSAFKSAGEEASAAGDPGRDLLPVGGGIAWRQLPSDFPPAMTVYSPFHSWAKIGVWQRIHDALRD
ncbi:transposase [Fodinicola feengrottensis]|uniref:transposase n=1 Tax=Fodinicola feengrottensis TaxID=435914 RepID=UPI0024437303|nr:transposase [Fodinicola feengrottensis]